MHMPHGRRYTSDNESGYGLGFYTGEYKGVRQVGHGGMLESYNCYLTLFPDRGVGVILQCNYENGNVTWDLVNHIYDRLLDLPSSHVPSSHVIPAPVTPNREAWPRHAGTYLSLQYGLASIKIVGDQLILERDGQATPLIAEADGLYRADGAPVGFVPEVDGPTQHLVIHAEPYHRFERDPSFVPDPEVWTDYPGSYVEWEIDPYPIRIRLEAGELFIKSWGDEVRCTAVSNTSFVSARGLIEFELAEDGASPVLITGKASRCYRISTNT
jgi:hypothetical protein